MKFGSSYAELKKNSAKRIALLKELNLLDKEVVSAGIHKPEGAQVVGDNGVKLIDIAVQNEYGNEWAMPHTVCFQKNGIWRAIKQDTVVKIPATNFIGRILENQTERQALFLDFKASIQMVIKGIWKSTDAVKSSGQYMRDRIRGFIDRKVFLPNAPMTIAAKGFDKRLYDKGTLYNAIKYKTKKAKHNE